MANGNQFNVLEKWQTFGFPEASEVVKTAEVVVTGEERYRIEVLRCYSNPKVQYFTRTLREEGGQWVRCNDPWTAEKTAEGALGEALSFIAERGRRPEST